MLELTHYLNLLAACAGAIGAVVAGLSWFFERKTRRRLELENKRRIWTDISKVRGLMTDLEKDAEKFDAEPGRMQAIGKLSFMMRDLIRDACMAEKQMSIDTVRRWRRVGKLGSDWQEQLALNVLQAEEIDPSIAAELPLSYGGVDELSESNPANAGIKAKRLQVED